MGIDRDKHRSTEMRMGSSVEVPGSHRRGEHKTHQTVGSAQWNPYSEVMRNTARKDQDSLAIGDLFSSTKQRPVWDEKQGSDTGDREKADQVSIIKAKWQLWGAWSRNCSKSDTMS